MERMQSVYERKTMSQFAERAANNVTVSREGCTERVRTHNDLTYCRRLGNIDALGTSLLARISDSLRAVRTRR